MCGGVRRIIGDGGGVMRGECGWLYLRIEGGVVGVAVLAVKGG